MPATLTARPLAPRPVDAPMPMHSLYPWETGATAAAPGATAEWLRTVARHYQRRARY